jgi:hypothetical protein
MRRIITRHRLIVAMVVALAVSSSACAGESSPTAVMSADEMRAWEQEANAFHDKTSAAWPDVDTHFADFAEAAEFYDPGSGDYVVEGQNRIISIHRPMADFFPDMAAVAMATFISADAAAFLVEIANLWPPWVPEPPDPPPVEFLSVYRFEDGLVTAFEVWNTVATFELTGLGCFADGGCVTELEAIADQYVAAWSSGDEGQIAALYAEDAQFDDTMFDLDDEGSDGIAGLSRERFELDGVADLEILDLAAQINGPDAPTETRPNQGGIIAVAIHYRWTTSIDGEPVSGDSLTTFELGTRTTTGFEPDPDGLITREEVFHDAESLIAAQITR